jgi:hypothetical protein
MTKLRVAVLMTSGLAACAFPRSGMMMMGAERLGSGNAEVGLASGLSASVQSQNGVTATQFQLPLVEANARLGLTDWADLNLHLGANGIQPGLKVGLTLGQLELAAMPTFAFGLFRQDAAGQGSSGSTTGLNVEAGLKALASHSIGGFAGVSYWFQYAGLAASGSNSASIAGHNFAVNVGWNFKAGPLRVRPELCLIFAGLNVSSGGASAPQGLLFTFMPGVTIATGSK